MRLLVKLNYVRYIPTRKGYPDVWSAACADIPSQWDKFPFAVLPGSFPLSVSLLQMVPPLLFSAGLNFLLLNILFLKSTIISSCRADVNLFICCANIFLLKPVWEDKSPRPTSVFAFFLLTALLRNSISCSLNVN